MRKPFFFSLLILGIVTMISCNKKSEQKMDAAAPDSTLVSKSMENTFGKLPDGQEVKRYTLKNKNGVEMEVINYGGIITSIKTPDKSGKIEDVVLGYDSLDQYVKNNPFFGAIVGRYGNRIAKGKFKLNGTEYTLAQNNNGQHLHGGVKGFDKVFWNIEEIEQGKSLRLTYTSKDMEEGYPGNLSSEVVYTLTDENELKISYKATTDKPTVVNLTQHTYFNLTGNTKGDILNHEMMIDADKFVPVDKVLIPTGKLQNVSGTPFDFNKPTAIGARINNKYEQLELGKGYDHCWVLSSKDSVKLAATVYEPTSGRFLEVFTTEPGIQFYSGNFLDGSITGKFNVKYNQRYGFCLETEHFPDSPNQPSFPSVTLNPGEVYKTQTTYKFSVK